MTYIDNEQQHRWYSTQSRNRSKEATMKTNLIKAFGSRYREATENEDICCNIDCYIDNKPYDIKATYSNKISLFRKIPTEVLWRTPILDNFTVPYLLPTLDANVFKVYTKSSILLHLANNPVVGQYTGDGNIQLWIDISNLQPDYILKGTV